MRKKYLNNFPKKTDFRDIYKIYFVAFIANLQFFGAVSIPFFLDVGNLNFQQIFILESFYTFFLFSTEIPNGVFADKFKRKISLSLALVFLAFGYLTFSLSSNFYLFILAEFFCALGAAFLSGADKALLYELIKDRGIIDAKKYLARLQSWSIFGMIIGLPLGSLFAKSNLILPYPMSLPFTFILSAFTCLIGVMIVLTVKEKRNNIPNTKSFIKIGYESCLMLYKNKRAFSLALNLVLISSPSFFIVWLYQPILANIGIDVQYYGLVACAFNILSFALLRHVEKFEKLLGIKNLLFFSGLVPGLIFFTFIFIKSKFLVICLIIICAGIRSLRQPIIGDYINSEIKDHNRATTLSAVAMMQRICLFLLNPLIGYLADKSLNLAMLFLGCAITLASILYNKKWILGDASVMVKPEDD